MIKKFFILVLILTSSCTHLKKRYTRDCSEGSSSKKSLTYNQDQVPLYNPAPLYPRRALELKLAGCVRAQLDIDDQGKTKNIKILLAKPSGVGFEREAKSALKRWRYQKKEKKNVKVLLDFELKN